MTLEDLKHEDLAARYLPLDLLDVAVAREVMGYEVKFGHEHQTVRGSVTWDAAQYLPDEERWQHVPRYSRDFVRVEAVARRLQELHFRVRIVWLPDGEKRVRVSKSGTGVWYGVEDQRRTVSIPEQLSIAAVKAVRGE